MQSRQIIPIYTMHSGTGRTHAGTGCTHAGVGIAYRWTDFIFVGHDSRAVDWVSGEVVHDNCPNLYKVGDNNIYIVVAGSGDAWHDLHNYLTTMIERTPTLTVQRIAALARSFTSRRDPVGVIVMGWDNSSTQPQLYRIVTSTSLLTGSIVTGSAVAVGTGSRFINLEYLENSQFPQFEEMGLAFHSTMQLLALAALSDSRTGGEVNGWVVRRNCQPENQYRVDFE